MKDVLIEIWQANAAGSTTIPADRQEKAARSDSFRGWGRTGTDFKTGVCTFETIKPGRSSAASGRKPMAPHVNVWIVARGINIGLNTRMYFGDEAEANANDPVLNLIEQPSRRAHADRPARGAATASHRLHLRHPSAGRGRDGVLRRVIPEPETSDLVMWALVSAELSGYRPDLEAGAVGRPLEPGIDAPHTIEFG